MSEPTENGDQPQIPQIPTGPVRFQLTITVNMDGSINVTGAPGTPITDRVLCYGLLGMAHDVLKDFCDNIQKSNILTLPPGSKLKPTH